MTYMEGKSIITDMQIATTDKSLGYLCKWLLAVILQVLRVDIEVIVVDGERLRTFGYAWHKLLHFKEDAGLLTDIKLLHGNVGWGNTIYMETQEARRLNKQPAGNVSDLLWAAPALISQVGCMDEFRSLTCQVRGYIVNGNIKVS